MTLEHWASEQLWKVGSEAGPRGRWMARVLRRERRGMDTRLSSFILLYCTCKVVIPLLPRLCRHRHLVHEDLSTASTDFKGLPTAARTCPSRAHDGTEVRRSN